MKQLLKSILIFTLLSVVVIGAFFVGYVIKNCGTPVPNINGDNNVVSRPYDLYSIENLSGLNILKGELNITELLVDEDKFVSYLFEYIFDPKLSNNSGNKKITGQINFPKSKEDNKIARYPLIFMLRGYVDQEIYETGDGTRNTSKYFAENGFITVAPDFLGYAGSDTESDNIFEARFQTYTTSLSLLRTITSIEKYTYDKESLAYWDGDNIFIWGHSNGGSIALTLLETTGISYPTSLWAPVSKPFPYSILYYTDESEDRGKLIRRELAKFEEIYDVEKYSFYNYLDLIKSPIQIHQGLNDDAVPIDWSDNLVDELEKFDLEITYHTYPGTDHNMQPSYNTAVSRDLDFFNSFIN